MKQTAVEFLVDEFKQRLIGDNLPDWVVNIIEQAKEMEKEQIIESWDNGFANGYDLGKHDITYPDVAEQYYNETFKSE